MQKPGLIRLSLNRVRAWWRLYWAEQRHDGAQATVEYYEKQLKEARLRAAATAQDLGAAEGAVKLARDASMHHQVCSGLGLR